MTFWTVFALALALSMDALAVAVAAGVKIGAVSGRQAFRLVFHFGLFQALMPVIGWTAGRAVAFLLEAAGPLIAFALLAIVGVHMIFGAFGGEGKGGLQGDPTRGFSLLALSVATSLDALAVGFSLSMVAVSVWWPALTIGLVCAAVTAAGIRAGEFLARLSWVRRAADLIGGIILIAIGARFLLS